MFHDLLILMASFNTFGGAEEVATKTKSLSLRDVLQRFLVAVAEMTERKEDRDGRSRARGWYRKRRKYQRDRYKYGAIYDSLMYS